MMPMRHAKKHYLRAWRKQKGLKLYELAARIESAPGESISDTYLGRIERYERPYNQQIMEAAAEALDIDVGDLFYPPPDHGRQEDDLTRHLRKLKTREQRATAARILAAFVGDDGGKEAG